MNISGEFCVKNFIRGAKAIIFFGSVHSNSKEQLDLILQEISNFNPELILVEGGFHFASFKSQEEAIESGGEMGYVSFLAKDKKINLESNDSPFSEDILFVEREYGRKVCFAYFFLRNISAAWTEEASLNNIKENSNWEGFEYSLDNLKRIVKLVLGEEYSLANDYSSYFNPTLNLNLFNKITLELNEFRDEFMLKKLKENLTKYNRIFIIKGVHHLTKNESKIRKLLEND